MELGLTGTALIIGMLAFSVRTWRDGIRGGHVSPETGLALAGAAMVVGAHAAVDFALRTPVYTITCGCLWGMVLAGPGRHQEPPSEAVPSSVRRLMLSALPACLGIVYAANAALEHRMIDRMDSSTFIERAKAQALVEALTWSPTSWTIWYHLGRQACVLGTPGNNQLCTKWITQSAHYNPNDYRVWMNLADQLEKNDGDVPAARDAMARARALRPYGLAHRWYEEPPKP